MGNLNSIYWIVLLCFVHCYFYCYNKIKKQRNLAKAEEVALYLKRMQFLKSKFEVTKFYKSKQYNYLNIFKGIISY